MKRLTGWVVGSFVLWAILRNCMFCNEPKGDS